MPKNDVIMYGKITGDFYARIPSAQAEYEKYFNYEKLSFTEAQEAVAHGYKITAYLLNEESKKTVKELYDNTYGLSAEDIDCAGLMFMCPVGQNVGITVPIKEADTDIPFYINFSSLSFDERDEVVSACLDDENTLIEVSIPGEIYDLIEAVFQKLNEDNIAIYEVLYQKTMEMNGLNAVDKMMVALANVDTVDSLEEACELDETDLDIEKGMQLKEELLLSLECQEYDER